jgi:predicted nicotinamide N-methyase
MTTKNDTRRAFGLKILNARHPGIRRLKREGHEPEIHGHKFWNSSFLIMNHLRRHPLAKGTRVMEIGCGWGLLGVFCAKQFGARVTGTDADAKVFPYLDLHAEVNGVRVRHERLRFEQLTVARLKKVDVIVGSDICFWDPMTPILFNLIRRALRANVKQVIISDPSRSPFTALAERCADEITGDDVDVDVLARHMARPVRASGELLVVKRKG